MTMCHYDSTYEHTWLISTYCCGPKAVHISRLHWIDVDQFNNFKWPIFRKIFIKSINGKCCCFCMCCWFNEFWNAYSTVSIFSCQEYCLFDAKSFHSFYVTCLFEWFYSVLTTLTVYCCWLTTVLWPKWTSRCHWGTLTEASVAMATHFLLLSIMHTIDNGDWFVHSFYTYPLWHMRSFSVMITFNSFL